MGFLAMVKAQDLYMKAFSSVVAEAHPAMTAGDQGYTQVDTLPGGGDYPDWARGMWYKGYAHRYIPDTGVYTPGKLLPRSAGSQANEALLGLGMAGLAVAALSRVLVS